MRCCADGGVRAAGSGSPTSIRGDGYEFVELRGYLQATTSAGSTGRPSARPATLQTRVVLEDVALTLAVVLDDSRSMRVGRMRMLLDAAREASDAWIAAARQRRPRRARRSGSDIVHRARCAVNDAAFSICDRALETARAGLRARHARSWSISDWYDLDDDRDDRLRELGGWCDCTALIARDPWFEGLPLGGYRASARRGRRRRPARVHRCARTRTLSPRGTRSAKRRCWSGSHVRVGVPDCCRRQRRGLVAAAFGLRRMTFDAPWAALCRNDRRQSALVMLYRRAVARADAQAMRYSNIAFLAASDRAAPLDRAVRCALRGCSPARCSRSRPRARICGCRCRVRRQRLHLHRHVRDRWPRPTSTPTRAGAAAAAARAFIAQSPAGVKIGLIAFRARAELIAPLSADKDATSRPRSISCPAPNGATAIGDALQLAASQFPAKRTSRRRADHRRCQQYWRRIRKRWRNISARTSFRSYTIGIGTANGDVIGGEQVDDR